MPARLNRFALTVTVLSAVLHAYIGWRLLPALSTLLIPLGMFARFLIRRHALADLLAWAGSLTMGLFSSVLVLTPLRDVVLVFVSSPPLATATALLVPSMALLITVTSTTRTLRHGCWSSGAWACMA
jgi:hypothetical protein